MFSILTVFLCCQSLGGGRSFDVSAGNSSRVEVKDTDDGQALEIAKALAMTRAMTACLKRFNACEEAQIQPYRLQTTENGKIMQSQRHKKNDS